MNHCVHPFHLLSVLLSAYLLLCLCCIILNTSSAEQHRRHHSHHTALHRHHPHHRSRNNHYHHHLIISSRSDQKQQEDDNEGWQEARTHRRNRTPRPPSPKPVVLNNQFQRVTPPPPSHSGQPRPPRLHPHLHPQGPPPPRRPGQRQECGENAEWVADCKKALKVFFATDYQGGNGCFATTCTFHLESGGQRQRNQGLRFGCCCRPNYIWEDGEPGVTMPAPFTATARCVLPYRCPAVERHQSTTPLLLHLSWTIGLARYRQWVAEQQAAGVWQPPNNGGNDVQTYYNEAAVLATSSWKVHFLALHEESRYRNSFISPQPKWHLLKEEVGYFFSLSLSPSFIFFSPSQVHERLLAQYGDQWARAFMPEHPASLGRKWTTSGPNTVPDLLYYAWSKHGSGTFSTFFC